MKAIRFEVVELGVASSMTEATTNAVITDPTGLSFGQVCTPLLFCKTPDVD